MLQLPFDIAQKGGGAKAEEVGLQPRVTKFVLHQREIQPAGL
ncbi:MAG: hypothetical protein RI979_1863 [Pseudomonadota bacterium]